MVEKITLKDHALERRIFITRLLVGCGVMLFLICLLIARLVFLQIYQFEYYANKSDNYRTHIQSVTPTRGLIYDRNGVLLADNKSSSTLTLVKEDAGDIDASISLLKQLIEFSDDDVDSFYRRLKGRRVPLSSVPLRFDLNEEEIARIAVNQFRLPGISVQAQLIRDYPEGEIVAHALGYLGNMTEEEIERFDSVNYRGTDQVGKMGVERFYEEVLHGKIGYETVERNARGQIMKVLERTDPVPGQDLVLNLDINLQRSAVAALDGHRGGIIALDIEDGGVLALVSNPSFDPNLFVQGISRKDYQRLNHPIEMPMFNRALARYAPGSTVKPFVGLAGLDSGVRTREYTIDDPGFYQINGDGHIFHDWTWQSSRDGHGVVNLERAIYQSCNTYFYDLAVDLGIEKMSAFMSKFGFGSNTSVDLPFASNGILPSKKWLRDKSNEPWYTGYTLNSSIGQGFTEASALQLATATAVIANKGRWVQPAMLRKLGLEAPLIIRESEMDDVLLNDESDWKFIAAAMEKVVHRGNGGYHDNGSAYPYIAQNEMMLYRMAGKSGTAQVVSNRQSEGATKKTAIPEKSRPHAWFIAFAPVHEPKIAVAIFVEHGVAGGRVAGPIARKVIDAYMLNANAQNSDLQTSLVNENVSVLPVETMQTIQNIASVNQ